MMLLLGQRQSCLTSSCRAQPHSLRVLLLAASAEIVGTIRVVLMVPTGADAFPQLHLRPPLCVSRALPRLPHCLHGKRADLFPQ